MNNEQEVLDSGPGCGAPQGFGSDDWQALEWQLMALVLDADEDGAQP
ncbi:hypothetical protein [Pseudomonas sp. TCU-HL1]|nr:hypothetical protein [Pseudomonas sp. TCU-HL1]AOE84104.1 DNA gyrase subunit B [Pseudomonas sp. TCU-HL1]